MPSTEVETVRGRVPVAELKKVLMHEHVFVTTPEIQLNYPHLWQEDERIADAVTRLANARDYWLGWGSADRSDGDLTFYRSGVAHPQLNGMLRVGHHSSPKEAVAGPVGHVIRSEFDDGQR